MKHLKKFYESIEDLYNEISKSEFETHLNDETIDGYHFLKFTDSEIEQIQNEIELDITKSSYNSILLMDILGKKYVKYNVFKCSDEWFVVQIFGKQIHWYKCDQIDGLIKCLKDKYEKS